MKESDIELVIERAKELYPTARPRIISDNGPQFVAQDFKSFIRISGMTHVRTSSYYPQSNGKLERFHGTLKQECIRPKTPVSLEDAKRVVGKFIAYYNTQRLHSAIGKTIKVSGLSIGDYFYYAALNRMIDPRSKHALSDWYRTTGIQEIRPLNISTLTSANYWKAWEKLDEHALEKARQAITRRLVTSGPVGDQSLVFDKGMNSTDNIESIDNDERLSFITSYSPYFSPQLMEIELSLFKKVYTGKDDADLMVWVFALRSDYPRLRKTPCRRYSPLASHCLFRESTLTRPLVVSQTRTFRQF